MNNMDLQKLICRAGEMASRNVWGDNAYKINMAILKADQNNGAACTRLAKYYKLADKMEEAKSMYVRALEINPENRGAINNLIEMEKNQIKANKKI